jgi:hypothetical protein
MVDRENLTFDFLDFVAVDTQMMNIVASNEEGLKNYLAYVNQVENFLNNTLIEI